ncbi:MAG: alpha/beta fold hydrolase, partial [Candidatus Heimdallarchaeota archaeon]|nr:alpha/beta fold hydrolase [Candidatus Heimdallarchaeota archaeon]
DLIHVTRLSRGPPVLFLHGFGSNADVWFAHKDSLGNYFKDRHKDCWSLHLSNATVGNIQSLANEDLYAAISFVFEKTQQPVLLVAHSMGGIIARVLTSPHFEHPFALAKLESLINGIVLLTVPHHGVDAGDVKKLEETAHQIRDYFKITKKISADFGLGFIQLLSDSALLEKLNNPPTLNPNIKWLNAIGKHDHVVPVKSAAFSPSEILAPFFEQKSFDCDHMVYPFNNILQKITGRLSDIATIFSSSIRIYPAIHRSPDVGEWIFKIFEE